MNYNEIASNLCYYDKRNPEGYYAEHNRWLWEDDDEIISPRFDSCACDNCFYNRDELAVEMIKLLGSLAAVTSLHESLLDGECCDHEVGICYCEDFNEIKEANKLLGVK